MATSITDVASRATARGTLIVKPGSEMDKDSFLKILSAELSNQDPDNAKDSTQYISQMAQFTSMEQMANLNNTMSAFAANSLIGKGVTINELDANGVPYTGIVRSNSIKAGKNTLSVEVNNNGTNEIKEVDSSDITSVIQVPDSALSYYANINGNMAFLAASSLIGKEVTLSDKDVNGKNYSGIIKGISKENGGIKLSVELSDTKESMDFTYDKLLSVKSVE